MIWYQITRLLDRDVRASPNAREHETLNINIPTETIKINKLIAEMQEASVREMGEMMKRTSELKVYEQ